MNEKFKILSLDGGGVRGYLSAKILENVEKHLNSLDGQDIPLGARFDFIVGTSTGGIIAALLALGKSASDIRALYEQDIPFIFSKNMRRNKLRTASISKFSSKNLYSKIEEYFEELTFNDVKTHLLLTSVDLTTATPRFHKSAYMQRNLSRCDELLGNAIKASTAAPTYFKAARNLKHSDYLIDGGIVANNPSLIALIDAFQFEYPSLREIPKPVSYSDVFLLSVGTGEVCEMPYNPHDIQNGGKLAWAKPISSILMEAQSKLAAFQMGFLFKDYKENYLRINPHLKTKFDLDEADRISELKNLADLNMDQINNLNLHFGERQ